MALARALAREPAVLLLDEPFAAVDRTVRRRLQDEIDELRRTLDMPLVLVTHDFDDVVRLATHVLILEQGRSVACGPVTTLMSRPDLSWLREAVGLGSVFDAVVARTHPDRGLVELDLRRRHAARGGSRRSRSGATVRVRIPAREVILATQRARGAQPAQRVVRHGLGDPRRPGVRSRDRPDRRRPRPAAGRSDARRRRAPGHRGRPAPSTRWSSRCRSSCSRRE